MINTTNTKFDVEYAISKHCNVKSGSYCQDTPFLSAQFCHTEVPTRHCLFMRRLLHIFVVNIILIFIFKIFQNKEKALHITLIRWSFFNKYYNSLVSNCMRDTEIV